MFLYRSVHSLLELLQHNGKIEMEEAIRGAIMHNIQSMMGARTNTVNPLLVIHVNRDTIVQDTINQVAIRHVWRKETSFHGLLLLAVG